VESSDDDQYSVSWTSRPLLGWGLKPWGFGMVGR